METVKERKQRGKAFRKTVSRSDLGCWEVRNDRHEVKELILAQEKTRVRELLPIRHERMAASPFAFFRGAAILQAHDLSVLPDTSFKVQACGDAHISNFGLYASPERRIVFDINDFDETLPAPFEADIKRLVASIVICGREKKLSEEDCAAAAYDAAAMYHKAMTRFSDMGNMDVWYMHVDAENFIKNHSDSLSKTQIRKIKDIIDRASSKNSEKAVEKLTEVINGKLRIKSDPPMIVPIRDLIGEEKKLYDFRHNAQEAVDIYRDSLPASIRLLIDQYKPLELAHKVVGVGSVGRKSWILVLEGRKNGDPLVLQIKEAGESVLEPYYGKSIFSNCGQRVVEGQRLIQTTSDILLGWLRMKSPKGKTEDYYVRQLWNAKGEIDLQNISKDSFSGFALVCAGTLAHAHAKTGDRHAIAGYLGKSDAFESAMVKYALAYADQNEADYQAFLKFAGKNV